MSEAQDIFEKNPLLLLSRKDGAMSDELREKLKKVAGSRYKPITLEDIERKAACILAPNRKT